MKVMWLADNDPTTERILANDRYSALIHVHDKGYSCVHIRACGFYIKVDDGLVWSGVLVLLWCG